MNKGKKLYEGKAKILYNTSDPDLMVQYFKDDASAFDGKKKGTIKCIKDLNQEELIKEIMNNQNTKKNIENKKINKCFFVKNRLINILI